MKRTLIFGEILCMIFFLFFSSADRRTQFLTSLAGPGMLSLVKQASAKATASEDFSIGTNAGITVEEPPRIALTFDDGPNARYTPILLDGLKKRNIRASFFLIGENIEGNEDILLQMRRDGHLIGNHTWDHVQLDKIPAEKARLEIEKTNNRIYEASGIYPSYVRPPFGAWIKDMELSVTMLPVFWDVDTLDWQSKNIDSILSIAQKQVHDGSIILMHDGYQTSVDAALKITDLFTEKGYVFVTADQLLLT
nr:polysaccharide deacetylase family protein [uncultured Blautia sp.]